LEPIIQREWEKNIAWGKGEIERQPKGKSKTA
jgi:hypothetical protein